MGSLLLLALALISMPGEVDALPKVLEIEDDAYISVSPLDDASCTLNISIRSPYTKGTRFLLTADLEGGHFWTADLPDEIYLSSLEQKGLEVTVFAVHGEEAGKEVTLTVTAETEDGEHSFSDSATIEVLPYLWASLEPVKEHLVDMELEGVFQLTLSNEGNTDIPSLISIDHEEIGGLFGDQDPVLVPADQGTTITVSYDMPADVDRIDARITPKIGGQPLGEELDIILIRELERVHILFQLRPILILSSTPLDDSVTLRCIGGTVEDITFTIQEGPNGSYLKETEELDLSSLDRSAIMIEPAGFSGEGVFTIRAQGTYEGETIVSNPWIIRARGSTESAGTISPVRVATGGAAAATGLLVGTAAYLYAGSEVWRYKFLAIGFVPLYAAVRKEKVLDHFFRGRLYEYIKEHPGTTYSGLKKHFEVNNGVLTYHLHRLEKEELLSFKNVGKYKLFYADGIRMSGGELILSQLDRTILEMIHGTPGIASTEVIRALKDIRAKRTLSRHLKDLQRKGLLEAQVDQGVRKLYLAMDWSELMAATV